MIIAKKQYNEEEEKAYPRCFRDAVSLQVSRINTERANDADYGVGIYC